MKNRVGIITFHRAINYGAVLQTFALQETITNHGADCKIIDFRCKRLERVYKPFLIRRGSILSMIKQTLTATQHYHERKEKKRKFDEFCSSRLNLTKPLTANLEALNSEFDLFITGSDQVFNSDHTGNDADIYYLSFAKKPRYSYAASFGKSTISNRSQEIAEKELKQYSGISLREGSAIEMVRSITGIQPLVHVDPTFLLKADEWRKLEKEPSGIQNRYILVYNMLSSEALYDAALRLSDITGYQVLFLNNKSEILKNKYRGFTYRNDFSPEEFLWLFDHSEYVLTSSFHGTVFSIIFRRQFLSILPDGEARNDRIIELLKTLSLMDRVFTSYPTVQNIDDVISYSEIERLIDGQRSVAITYLNNMISSIAGSVNMI